MHHILALSQDTANNIDGAVPIVLGLIMAGIGALGTDRTTQARFAGNKRLLLVGGGLLVAGIGALRMFLF